MGQSALNGDEYDQHRSLREIYIVKLHPDYDNTTAYFDVGLIHLSRGVAFSRGIQPICFPANATYQLDRNVGKYVSVAGWGRQVGSNDGSTLKRANLRIMSAKACAQRYDIRGKPLETNTALVPCLIYLGPLRVHFWSIPGPFSKSVKYLRSLEMYLKLKCNVIL